MTRVGHDLEENAGADAVGQVLQRSLDGQRRVRLQVHDDVPHIVLGHQRLHEERIHNVSVTKHAEPCKLSKSFREISGTGAQPHLEDDVGRGESLVDGADDTGHVLVHVAHARLSRAEVADNRNLPRVQSRLVSVCANR